MTTEQANPVDLATVRSYMRAEALAFLQEYAEWVSTSEPGSYFRTPDGVPLFIVADTALAILEEWRGEAP